jgi:hypothetical protein
MKAGPADAELSRQVVRYGSRVLETAASAKVENDASIVATRDSVAQAAAVLWRTEKDRKMLELAIKLDRAQLDSGNRTASSLRRLGELMEASGDNALALAAWRELLNGLPNGSTEWYEARYESLRLLAASAPAEAAEVMRQHKILHPDFGPEPWGPKLAGLDARLGSLPPPAAPQAPAKPPGDGGGGAGSGGGG